MLNKVFLIGNLGRDPELKHTANSSVCTFSVATTRKYKHGDTYKEDTEWSNIVTWGSLADNCKKYLAKGRQVFVEGYKKTRTWETPAGEKRYAVEIVAQTVQFLGGKQDQRPNTEIENLPSEPIDDDDAPF